MEKQVINRGYLTHALTDGESKIYGIVKNHYISDWSHEPRTSIGQKCLLTAICTRYTVAAHCSLTILTNN